jgi:uncharacterized protein YndB with AHSA1/START domain
MTLPAARERVWALWSTSDGLSSWAAPLAAIELRIGGVWEASYRRGARVGEPGNIRNRVLSFLPDRMLSIQIEAAPPGFEHLAEARTLWTVIELESVSPGETRVRVSMAGYRDDAAYDALYRQFEAGNAWTLKKLHERVTIGPVDWRTLAPAPSTPADAP